MLHGWISTVWMGAVIKIERVTQLPGVIEAVELQLVQLSEGLLLGKTRLIDLLLGVKHIEQRARTQIQILLLIEFTGAGAERLLTALNLQRAQQA
ncbi:hypothetical protein QE396_004410 [Enterobacter sp. SORGH_AS 287]|nr:hypothetical protein [Enterobacter sp. SORGH_AS_0287]